MNFAISIPDWNSLDSVRHAHSELEAAALVFFALLVLFDVLAHLSKDEKRTTLLEKIGLGFFAVAVLAEVVAYPYGQRNDTLSAQVIGSLDAKSREASTNASNALTKSSEAETKADEAVSKAVEAEGRMDRAIRRTASLERQTGVLDNKIRQAKAFADIALARTHPRAYRMDGKKFLEQLKGIIPCDVEVWYKPEDVEAYDLAAKIVQLLGRGADGTGKNGLGWKNVIGPLPLKDKPRLWAKNAKDIPPPTFLAAGFSFGGGFAVADAAIVGEPNSGATVWRLSAALDASGIHFMWITQDVSVPVGTVRVIVLSQFD